MSFYYTPFIVLPLLSAGLNAGVALFSRRRRQVPAASPLFWLMVAMSGWSLCYVLNTASTTIAPKIFFFGGGIVCVCLLAPSLLALSLESVGLRGWLTRRRLLILCALPAFSTALVLTCGWHRLHAYDFILYRSGALLLLGYREGPFFLLHSAFVRLVTLASLLLFVSGFWRMPKSERFRFALLIVATVTPLTVNVLSGNPGTHFNYTTSSLFLSGICYALAVFRYRLLDLLPLARTALFDQIGEPVLVFNDRGQLVECNDAARRLSVGGCDGELAAVRCALYTRFPSFRLGPRPDGGREQFLSDALDEGRCWRVASSELSTGAIKGRLVLLHDVTSLKRTENRLTESQRRLRELNATLKERVEEETRRRLSQERLLANQARLAAMGEMIGVIAHQWRQPLSTLAMIVQRTHALGTLQGLTPNALEDFKNDALAQIWYMSDTIEEFSGFYRPEKQQELFSPDGLIAESIRLFEHQFKSCAVRVWTTAPDGPLVQVLGYPNEFKQVILNLLSNARDGILESRKQRGEPERGEIGITLAPGGVDTLAIEIRDNGCGIPAEVAARVFDPYFTTKEKSGGTGIGLYMSRMIVEDSLGGSLTLLNSAEGAAFRIELPIKESP